MPLRAHGKNFWGLMPNGRIIRSTNADSIQEAQELIVDGPGYSMAFEDGQLVPYFETERWGQPPVQKGHVLVYSGGERRITQDGRWLGKSHGIWNSAYNHIGEARKSLLLASSKIGGAFAGGGFLILLIVVFMAFSGGGEDPKSQPASGQQTQATETTSQETTDGPQLSQPEQRPRPPQASDSGQPEAPQPAPPPQEADAPQLPADPGAAYDGPVLGPDALGGN